MGVEDDEYLLDQWSMIRAKKRRCCSPARIFVAIVIATFLALIVYILYPTSSPIVQPSNLDKWFSIPVVDHGKELTGKLWSTRCPRKVQEGGASYFEEQVKLNEVTRVFTLIEEHEDTNTIKRAGVPLKPYYTKLGLEMERFPMRDYSVPEEKIFVEAVNHLLQALRNGEHVVVHCGSGWGRTGMVLNGLYRKMEVEAPLKKLKEINSNYLDTKEQEEFVTNVTL